MVRRFQARGVRREPGTMNQLEARYAQQLEARKLAGEVLWYVFDAIKLRLAPKTFFTPDFFVLLANYELEVHEAKGFMEDDAAVKLKVAASLFPFRFWLVKYPNKATGWTFQEIAA